MHSRSHHDGGSPTTARPSAVLVQSNRWRSKAEAADRSFQPEVIKRLRVGMFHLTGISHGTPCHGTSTVTPGIRLTKGPLMTNFAASIGLAHNSSSFPSHSGEANLGMLDRLPHLKTSWRHRFNHSTRSSTIFNRASCRTGRSMSLLLQYSNAATTLANPPSGCAKEERRHVVVRGHFCSCSMSCW